MLGDTPYGAVGKLSWMQVFLRFFFSDSVCVFIGRRDTYKCMSSKRRQFAFC